MLKLKPLALNHKQLIRALMSSLHLLLYVRGFEHQIYGREVQKRKKKPCQHDHSMTRLRCVVGHMGGGLRWRQTKVRQVDPELFAPRPDWTHKPGNMMSAHEQLVDNRVNVGFVSA